MWCQEPRCSPRVRPVCRGSFGVASRVKITVSQFKTERGTSLEMLQWAWASSGDDGESTLFFLSCGGILVVRRGNQASSCFGPGSPNFQSTCEGELGVALESLQGKRDLT